MLIIYGITPINFLLFTFFAITGGLIIVSYIVIGGSLSFWYGISDVIVDTFNTMITTIATYPDSIFKGFVKIVLYTIVPVGIVSYVPLGVIEHFNPIFLIGICIFTIISIILAFIVFNIGLKKYTSTNLMNART